MTDYQAIIHRLALAGIISMLEQEDKMTPEMNMRMLVLHARMMNQHPLKHDNISEVDMLGYLESIYE